MSDKHPKRKIVPALLLAVVLAALSLSAPAAASGQKPSDPQPVVDPCNDRLSIQVASNGNFNLGAFPDPGTCTTQTGSFGLTFAWPSPPSGTSYTTVRIDGQNAKFGDGTLVQAPTDTGPLTNQSAFQHGDIVVTQTLSIATNPQTGQADAARIAYTVRNDGTSSHDVGVRAMLDTDVNDNDGAPYRIPGVGAVTTETDLSGANVPASFQVFQDLTDTDHVASGTLTGGGAVTPDRFVVAAWAFIVGQLWDYTIDPDLPITTDSAYATYWNPQPLAAGQQRTYVTYFGLGDVSLVEGPLDVGVTGPAALDCVDGAYTPDPFDIVATIHANQPAAAATATLNLPARLSLASGTALVQLGNLAAGDEVQVTWSVTTTPQDAPGAPQYTVTAAGADQAPTSVTRVLQLPACTPELHVPGPPTNVQASPGDGNAVVTWTPPDDGGTPIDLYQVTCSAVGGGDDPHVELAEPNATSLVIPGLLNGVTYACVVAAHNLIGFGPPSAATDPFTPQASTAQFSMTIDTSVGGILLIDPQGPADLGTSGKIKIPPQFGPPTQVTVTATLFGVPGETDATCGGNVCIGQGIEWSVSDPDAIKRMRVKFIEDPSLTHGGRAEDATAYKDGAPVGNCPIGVPDRFKPKPCIVWRWTSRGGLWQITFLVDGNDPKGRI